VEPQYEPLVPTREQIAPGLLDVERPTLDEDVRGGRDSHCVGEHLRDQPVDVGIGVGLLRRHGVRPEPGRDATGRTDGLELRELRVAIEAVPALALERRRAVREHRIPVAFDDRAQGIGSGGPCGAGRRQDPTPRR
jgi:hypothetical protein